MHAVVFTGEVPVTVYTIVEIISQRPIATNGDAARYSSREIALAASMGWISVINPDGKGFGSIWKVTAAGLVALNHRTHK